MAIIKPSLEQLIAEEEQRAEALLGPLEDGKRLAVSKVLARVRAGARHLTGQNLEFLAQQMFPSTADREYLREHWRDRVAPLAASFAAGYAELSGLDGTVVPAGLLWRGNNGQFYRLSERCELSGGTARARFEALEAGIAGNLASGELRLASSQIAGLHATATVLGIDGGADDESDEAYRSRIEAFERQGVRIGRSGDWAAWAKDASPEVSWAWEFANWDASGAILLVLIGGNHEAGLQAVGGLEQIQAQLARVAPFALVDLRSAEVVPVAMKIALLEHEDTASNRQLVEANLRKFWSLAARPEMSVTEAQLRAAVEDGKVISSASVELSQPTLNFSRFELPTQGVITWL